VLSTRRIVRLPPPPPNTSKSALAFSSVPNTHIATVRLFPKEHRLLAHRTVGTISEMIRTYIVANVLFGLLNALLCALIFWLLGIKYFYFVGALSGFILAGRLPDISVQVCASSLPRFRRQRNSADPCHSVAPQLHHDPRVRQRAVQPTLYCSGQRND